MCLLLSGGTLVLWAETWTTDLQFGVLVSDLYLTEGNCGRDMETETSPKGGREGTGDPEINSSPDSGDVQ